MTRRGRTLPVISQPTSKIGAPTPVGKVRPVLSVVPEEPNDRDDANPGGVAAPGSVIDQIVRDGARRMLAEALQAEVDAYIAQFVAERDEAGRRLVVRNGSHQPREVLTSAGAVQVIAPRVNDRRTDPDTGGRMRFSHSATRPPTPAAPCLRVKKPCGTKTAASCGELLAERVDGTLFVECFKG
jgi:mutator family transposase